MEHIQTEKEILQNGNHPFLVNLEYAFQNESKLYFVMNFMKGGELFQHLKKQGTFQEMQAKFYTCCIILALGHLHNIDFIYRDLKLENIMLDEKGYARLTDFGLAKFIKKEELAKTFCGTPEYLSPEILRGEGHNRPSDWWCVGILVYEMMFGIPPYVDKNMNQMYRMILKEKIKFRAGIKVSDSCKDFINRLLEKDPNKRLGSKFDSLEVLNHDWLKEVDIQLLIAKKYKAPFIPQLDENFLDNFDPDFTKE